jgi:hypothetical protein
MGAGRGAGFRGYLDCPWSRCRLRNDSRNCSISSSGADFSRSASSRMRITSFISSKIFRSSPRICSTWCIASRMLPAGRPPPPSPRGRSPRSFRLPRSSPRKRERLGSGPRRLLSLVPEETGFSSAGLSVFSIGCSGSIAFHAKFPLYRLKINLIKQKTRLLEKPVKTAHFAQKHWYR